MFPIMPSTIIAQIVPALLNNMAARAKTRKNIQTSSALGPLVEIQNNFTFRNALYQHCINSSARLNEMVVRAESRSIFK